MSLENVKLVNPEKPWLLIELEADPNFDDLAKEIDMGKVNVTINAKEDNNEALCSLGVQAIQTGVELCLKSSMVNIDELLKAVKTIHLKPHIYGTADKRIH